MMTAMKAKMNPKQAKIFQRVKTLRRFKLKQGNSRQVVKIFY